MRENLTFTSPQLRIAWRLYGLLKALDSAPRQRAARIVRLPITVMYRFISLSLVGMDIPSTASVSPHVRIYHGVGLVVHKDARVAAGVILRQNTTIGKKAEDEGAPVIERGVDIGANCVILGEVTLGEGAVVGAGSVVIRDVPAGMRVAGVPARPIADSRAPDSALPVSKVHLEES